MDRAALEMASTRSRQIVARRQRLCGIHWGTGTAQIPWLERFHKPLRKEFSKYTILIPL
jgi:hypothetical protein